MDKRREIKMAYKQQEPSPMGVYQVKNKINGRIFIGSSRNLSGTANSYFGKLQFDSHHNKNLQEDLRLHGSDAFSFEILETLDTEDLPKENVRLILKELKKLEDKWLNTLQPFGNRGYNNPKRQEMSQDN